MPLTHATLMLRKGIYKMIYYTGRGERPDLFELYDLENDPEEMNDLYQYSPRTDSLKGELLSQLALVNSR
jgi:hypothetical protein